MRLFSSPATPFGRMATVTIHECGLAGRVEVVHASGTPLDPGTMPVAQNPLGKIPVLVLTDDAGAPDLNNLYWNMSIWGNYNVVLMQTDLTLVRESVQ